MPKVKVNDITINYEIQGSGEPLILIPYLGADHACYSLPGPGIFQAFHLHFV